MLTKGSILLFSVGLIATILGLTGCASDDMKSMDDSMQQKTMMKETGNHMNDDMGKQDDMDGSM